MVLGWSHTNIASAAIINEPMTGVNAPNWVIGGSAYLTASTGLDPVGDGWLRFTSIANDQAGYGYLNTAFNITQGAVIQFDYVTWGGAGNGGFGCGETGADGYSVYLFDGSQSFSVGASGGSLEYDKKTVAPVHAGLNYGYIGVGIDEWGNFSNPTEGRLGGPGGRCNGVAVRGPYNHPSGAYYYLGGTASNVAPLAFPGQAYRPGQTGLQYRKVLIYLTPQSLPDYLRVDVYLQVGYNQPFTQVLNGLMVGQPVPASVKIGYAAGTGGATNYHEIRNLIIDPLPSSNIDLGITKVASTPTPTAGGPLTYTVTVRNYGPSNVTANNVPIADTVPADLTGVTWTCAGSGGATCGSASGSGNSISTTATLPVNSYATYTISGTVNPGTPPGTQIANTAALTVPSGITDTDSGNNSSSVTVSVTAAPVTVSGYVYSDNAAGGGVAHNGIKDGTEGTTNRNDIYAKLFRASDLTTALQVVNVVQATGLYTFNNVTSYDTYVIILGANNTAYAPSFPSGNWIYTSPVNYELSAVSVGGSNLTNQNFGVWNGSRVSGKVIKDDGFNGALANANDGVLNAAEVGLSGVTVRLANNTGGTTYDTTTTDSGGNFALFTNTASATLRIYETNPGGYVSVSDNVGTTGGTYTIGGEYVQFAYTLYTDYSNVLFGDVPDNAFTPTPQGQNGMPSTTVYYAHTLAPGSGGSVTFATNARTTTPAAPAWGAVVYYQDAACNGVYDSGTDTAIGGALTAAVGTNICILAGVAIPAGAAAGTTDALTIRASFTFTNSVGPVVRTYDVTDTTTVIAPDLSTSTKTWVDQNGGDTEPGDVVRYTVTLIETGGVAVSNASVTDDIPANVTGFTVVNAGGGTNSSTGAGTGANNTGYLNITNISVPASGSVTIVFDVTVAGGTPVGTLIDNCATIANPSGPGAAPCASTITVSGSSIPASGNKPLYLYQSTLQMSRTPNTEITAVTLAVSGGTQMWPLSPVLQLDSTLSPAVNANVPVYLVLRRGAANGNRSVTVNLQCSSGGTTLTQTQLVALTNARTLYTFNLPLGANLTCTAGNAWNLTVTNNSAADSIRWYAYRAGPTVIRSYANLPTTSVINVDSVAFYDAAYPGGSAVTSVAPGATVYVRSVISDPFGSYDITAATVKITDSLGAVRVNNAAMTQAADSGAATKTYEYTYAVPASPTGSWTVRVDGAEGTEGTVSDYGQTALTVAIPQPSLTIVKSVQTYSDPINGTSGPKSIPGAVMEYEIIVSNSGPGTVDSDTLAITDAIPQYTSMCVSTTCKNPVLSFACASCGLTFDPAADVTYSSAAGGGAPYNHPASPDADGFDEAVTGVRINPKGIMSASPSTFTLRFRVRVK